MYWGLLPEFWFDGKVGYEAFAKRVKGYTLQKLDWLDLVITLRKAGFIDDCFSIKNIRRLPINFIVTVSNKAVNAIKQSANLEAVPVAKLAVLIYKLGMAFTEGEGEDPSVYDFLPFADVEDNKPKLSRKASEIIRGLIRDNQLPKNVIPLVARHLI